MDIALIGYGKMGQAIEEIAKERGHNVVLKISRENRNAFSESNLQMADVAIEFTHPSSAMDNVLTCLNYGIPVVCGTTGWHEQLPAVKDRFQNENGSFLYASNFSLGVNLFFELNEKLADLMAARPEYQTDIRETHHTHKKDAPSGTAITLAEQIIASIENKKGWKKVDENDLRDEPGEFIYIQSFREGEVPGTHCVRYFSDIDELEIKHTAHSRKGFALGAVLAAEFIQNKKGIFTMRDVLRNQE